MKKLVMVLMVLILTVVLLGCGDNDVNYWRTETLYTQEELDMTVALYEAKLDWYEEQHNIDFDDVPNEFIAWLEVEHPDVYEYFKE